MTIFLIGFMGCGKSTVGRRLAAKLGFDFVDMDASIEQQQGRTISEIFAEEGEAEFRRMESEFIRSFSHAKDAVVATGGGAPCFSDNMDRMKEIGSVVYMKMSPNCLAGRLRMGRFKRPKLATLTDEELVPYITRTLEEREPYYRQASVVIDCDGVDDDYVVSHIRFCLAGNEGEKTT